MVTVVEFLSKSDEIQKILAFQFIDSKIFWHLLSQTQPAKLDLNKKSFPKQKTIQNFTINTKGFRKTKNENPPTWEIGVTS